MCCVFAMLTQFASLFKQSFKHYLALPMGVWDPCPILSELWFTQLARTYTPLLKSSTEVNSGIFSHDITEYDTEGRNVHLLKHFLHIYFLFTPQGLFFLVIFWFRGQCVWLAFHQHCTTYELICCTPLRRAGFRRSWGCWSLVSRLQ